MKHTHTPYRFRYRYIKHKLNEHTRLSIFISKTHVSLQDLIVTHAFLHIIILNTHVIYILL